MITPFVEVIESLTQIRFNGINLHCQENPILSQLKALGFMQTEPDQEDNCKMYTGRKLHKICGVT